MTRQFPGSVSQSRSLKANHSQHSSTLVLNCSDTFDCHFVRDTPLILITIVDIIITVIIIAIVVISQSSFSRDSRIFASGYASGVQFLYIIICSPIN